MSVTVILTSDLTDNKSSVLWRATMLWLIKIPSQLQTSTYFLKVIFIDNAIMYEYHQVRRLAVLTRLLRLRLNILGQNYITVSQTKY